MITINVIGLPQPQGSMKSLKEVDLQGTGVTEKGAAGLKAAKPGLMVFFGPWDAKSANYRNN